MQKFLSALGLFTLILLTNLSLAQTGGVGVNNTGVQPDASSILDVSSANKGMLIPRIALSATNVSAPVNTPATSLLVYNTASAGAGATAVTPGFYFWNGTEWERLVSGFVSSGTDDQTLTLTGTNLTIEDGNTVNLSGLQDGTGTDDQTLTLTGTNLAIEDGNSVNLSSLQDGTGTDDQNLTGATLTGTSLQIDIENGTSTTVNLAGLQDGTGTDDQALSYNPATNILTLEDGGTVDLSGLTGTGTDDQNLTLSGTNLTIEDGNTVNLSGLQDGTGTDDQTLTLTGTNLAIEDGNSVNLSSLQDGTGTDDQNLTGATLTGTSLQIDIEGGNSATVNLSGLQDGTGTDDQNLTLSGTNLTIEDGNTVNLSGLQDGTGTDDQTLTLTGTNLAIEDGNSVNLSSLQDGTGTDDQNLTGATLTGTTLQIDIEGGNSATVNLSGLQDGTGTDDQNLTLSGTNLTIEDGNTVDLSSLAGGNDAWKLTGNAATSTDFLGTTNPVDLVFKRGNLIAGRLGLNNTSFGVEALASTSGSFSVAIGRQAMSSSSYGGSHNVALGYAAMEDLTTGSSSYNYARYNVGIGTRALGDITTGKENVAIGHEACRYGNGYYNTAIGYKSMLNNGASGGANYGNYNVAIGHTSLGSNTEGSYNVAVGNESLFENTTGKWNVAIGMGALYENTTTNYSVAVGNGSLGRMIGGDNIGVGYQALSGSNTVTSNIGTENIGIGNKALQLNSSGERNIGVGSSSLSKNSSGIDNTGVGYWSLYNNTSGNRNVAVGRGASYYNVTGSNNTSIGVGAGPPNGVTNLTNYTVIGYAAQISASNKMRLGNTSVSTVETENSFSTISDARFKNNVQENVPGLEFITQLRPVTYHFDVTKRNEFIGIPDSLVDHESVKQRESELRTGFIAQEIEKTAKELNYEFDGVITPQNERDNYSVSYSKFVVPLVKAVQEQQDIIEAQNKRIEALEKWISEQQEGDSIEQE